MSRLVIHITSKSYVRELSKLEHRLSKKFRRSIYTININTLCHEFIRAQYRGKFDWKTWKEFNQADFQKYLDEYVSEHITHHTSPLVIVGLNNHAWLNASLFYDLHATHTYYLQTDKEDNIVYLWHSRIKSSYDDDYSYNVAHHNTRVVEITNSVRDEHLIESPAINAQRERHYLESGYIAMPYADILASVKSVIKCALASSM